MKIQGDEGPSLETSRFSLYFRGSCVSFNTQLLVNIVCMYVFNFFRDAILISYTAGFHEGRLFSCLQVYKNEEKTN